MLSRVVRHTAHTLLCGASAALFGCSAPSSAPPPGQAGSVRHVAVIVLENRGFDATFGTPGTMPYLTDTLVPQGLLLRNYYAIAHNSLANYIAMISGIAPTPETQNDCPIYQEFVEAAMTSDGQPVGTGCIYPASITTLPNQLALNGFAWKAYMEDMGNDPTREPPTCGHVPIDSPDQTQTATSTDEYAQRHDPFVYFHAIIDSAACASRVVPLAQLQADLASAETTPNFLFVTPNLCHDGHDTPCKDGEPGGLVSADAFLQRWVPVILASPAFRTDGLVVVTFDEASTSDASACCGERRGPNTLAPGGSGPGGGRVGALLLSPFVGSGAVSDTPYNHYSLLRTIEDAFGLPHLGYAGDAGLNAIPLR